MDALDSPLAAYRELLPKHKAPAPSPDGKPPEKFYQRGFLLPYLLAFDDAVWGRWDYWARTVQAGRVLAEPIPKIQFQNTGGHRPARAHIERCLDMIPGHGSYRGWSSASHFEFFLDFLLFGFGHNHHPPIEPSGCGGASARLYAGMVLQWFLAYPYDYFGDIFADSHYGRHAGFFPTPMEVTHFCAEMAEPAAWDAVNDPCVGTGRMLLSASNHSLRLSGTDILGLMVKATIVNGFMYAPWLARPFPESCFPPDQTAGSPGQTDTIRTPGILEPADQASPGPAARKNGSKRPGAKTMKVRDLSADPEMARRAVAAFPALANIIAVPTTTGRPGQE